MPETAAKPKQYTPQEFAAIYKQQYPQFSKVPDDQLVQQVLSSHPELRERILTGVTTTYRGNQAVSSRFTTSNSSPIVRKQTGKEAAAQAAGEAAQEPPEATMMESFAGAPAGDVKAAQSDPRKLGAILPPALAALATASAGPESSMIRRSFGRALPAGAAGGLINEGIQHATGGERKGYGTAALEGGGVQALLEMLGGIVGWPLQRLTGGMRSGMPVSDAERANAKFKLGLTPRDLTPESEMAAAGQFHIERNPYTHRTAETARDSMRVQVKNALGNVSETFGNTDLNIAGQRVQHEVKFTSKRVFQQEVDRLDSIVNAYGHGHLVDIRNLKTAAENEMKAIVGAMTYGTMPDPLTGDPQMLALQRPGGVRSMILEDITKLDDLTPFNAVKDLRSRLMGLSRKGAGDLFTNESTGTAKKYVQLLTQDLDASAKGKPDLERSWNKFRNFTRKGYTIFQAGEIKKMLRSNPEDVAAVIGKDGITEAIKARRAILGYSTKYGNPEEAAAGVKAWDDFRLAYAGSQIIQGQPLQLHARLAEINPKVLDTIFNTDAKGRLALKTLKELAAATSQVKELPFPRGSLIPAYLEHLATLLPSRIIYNPTASRLMVRGIGGLLSEVKYAGTNPVKKAAAASARGVGGMLTMSSPRIANAIADIGRAIAIAESTEEAFPDISKAQTQAPADASQEP